MPQPPAPPTRRTPFFIVMNAHSGSRNADEARATLRRVFDAAGQSHEFLLIDRPEDTASVAQRAAAAARDHQGVVIAAGGDGTINAVAQAVLPTGLAFGIVPLGTFNYSARAHSIPLDTEGAARMLFDARLKPIQVGLVNGRIFLVNASLGLYPELLRDREQYKQQFGRSRTVAFLAGLRSLLQVHRQLALEIEHDSEREFVRTPTLFVGNNPLQLEQVGVPEAEDVQRRKLAAIIVRARGSASLLWLALRGALGQLGEAQNVRNFSFRRMIVNPWLRHGRGDITVAVDGELLRLRPPLEFSVAPQPLWLLAPRES